MLDFYDLSRLGIDIHEANRHPRCIEGKKSGFGQMSDPIVAYLDEYDPAKGTGVALESHIFQLEGAMMPSGHGGVGIVHGSHPGGWRAPKVFERM